MRFTDLVRSYQRDPFYPTWLPLAVFFAARDRVWFRSNGQPRRFKPSQFDNPISSALNASLFRPTRSRRLALWERVLLALGF